MRSAKAVATLLAVLTLCLGSCTDSGGPTSPDLGPGSIPTRSVGGSIALPDGAPADPATLEVLSFADRATVGAAGDFTILVPDTDLPQVVLVMGEGTAPLLLGVVWPVEPRALVVDATSTADALVLLNPFTLMFRSGDCAAVVEAARQKPEWTELADLIETLVTETATGRLDGTVEPGLFQLAASVTIDGLGDFPGGLSPYADPWTEDAAGDLIALTNPDPIYYAACFTPTSGGESLVAVAGSDREGIRIDLGWPPVLRTTAITRTYVDLGGGTFDVTTTRGNLASFDPATAEGIAGIMNASRGVVEVVSLGSGTVVDRDPLDLGLASMAGVTRLGSAARTGDTYKLTASVISLVSDEGKRVATWLWEKENQSCEDYLATLCPLLAETLFSTEVLAAGESRIPFFSRLISAGTLESHRISQVDGVMAYGGNHAPPAAAFDVSPSFAEPGVPVSFDASMTTDPDDSLEDLQTRWDWENDGEWDTPWTNTLSAVHSFEHAGTHEIVLQVRDTRLLIDTVVHTLNVGGGEESAEHIVIFRDVVPWAPEVPPILDEMLEVLELVPGEGPKHFEIVGSDEMGSFPLTPGDDLVIIQSDQTQAFYDAYAANQVRFLQFVQNGGTIFWEACDLGWHDGSIDLAGIVLPGAVTLHARDTWYNFVSLPGAPLVEGLPDLLYGQFASHEYIANLPDGATVYAADDAGGPTLVEFGYGDGWVIMTTQPLEWNFYNNWSCGQVMPHVVTYVLGMPLVHDFGDIVKPEERGRPAGSGGANGLTSGTR
jgi:hypothetical protein